ncbi:MAG: Fe-S cluster assembly protein SufD [Rhizobiales bacterium]|nr:Fe-S cluster assembly protein SufD [Hyphomicrobiales bacterium]
MGAHPREITKAEHDLAAMFARTEATEVARDAFALFSTMGLPHRRVEAWHYTDLRAKLGDIAPLAKAPSAELVGQVASELDAASVSAARIVFVDGRFVAGASRLSALPAGVRVGESDAVPVWPEVARDEPTIALNAAFAPSATVIEIAAGADVVAPIEIYSYVTAAAQTYARILVRVGAGVRATIVETHDGEGAGAHQKNSALIFEIGDDARVEHIARHVDESAEATHVASFAATLGARAQLDSFALVAGGALTRRQLYVRFDGDHARVGLRGAALLRGNQHCDTTLVVDHAALDCESRERFKHIVEDEATGVYQGKVIVRPGAQKTDGAMKSDAILLSESARMHNKPELEIFADDVVCGHGATVGALDDEQLFYLRARGLPKAEAETLLLEAFAGEVIEAVRDETMQEALRADAQAWLSERHS